MGFVSPSSGVSSSNDALLAALGVKAWSQDPHICSDAFAKNTQFIHGGAVYLYAGTVITTIDVFVGTVGAAMTNYLVGLADANFTMLATSANAPATVTTLGWRSLNLSAPYTILSSGLYYLLELGVGGTMPLLMGARLANGTTAGRGALANNKMYWWFDSSQAWAAFPAIGQVVPVPQASSNDHCLVAR
jgi:hypothetical protein